MSFRGCGQAVPRNYVPGLGRGAAGFTTRSDVGPAAPIIANAGSRAAEARAARFGAAPSGYQAGAGRGAGNVGANEAAAGVGTYDPFGGYMIAPQQQQHDTANGGQYDDDDDEADLIWAAIDERMKHKRKKNNDTDAMSQQQPTATSRQRIGAQFRELKESLADVSEDQWASIPEVGDYSLKYKHSRKQESFTPLTDTLLEQRTRINTDATAGSVALAGTAVAAADNNNNNEDGYKSVVKNMSGLSAARGTVLGMSLDKHSDAVGNQTTVDPQGYLTSLASSSATTFNSADVGDISKARLLLKSVRDTNPKHGPGWIASARVEEAAGKTLQARKIIQEGCHVCPENEDVWLEAARLHPHEVAKSILATAVRRIPTSIKIFLKAADLETTESSKKAVLRKALEANPTSVALWKAAIEMENANDARILLSVAVEKIPHSVDMWLALSRLESYENAQKVLNKARKALPVERSIWIAAAKLEESQNHKDRVDTIVQRAVKALKKNDAVVTRAQWLQEAESAEASGSPVTSASIVQYSIGMDVEDEDRQRTWSEDAKGTLSRGSVATARAILSHALSVFPQKRNLWMQAVDLERKHGTASTLDQVLAAASERLPNVEIFWLVRAKERWVAGDIEKAREVITDAFKANPESEAIWLAAAKLEWETGEVERATLLLQRARERAPTDRVYMKSALFEREQRNFDRALELIDEGITNYPNFAKLYMMGGQICSEDLPKDKSSLEKARKYYQKGLQQCSSNTALWILASRLEERAGLFTKDGNLQKPGVGSTKARSLLEVGRLKNPKNDELWLEAVRLESRTGNVKLAEALMARALQDCPSSGLLLAENIYIAPRIEQKSKSADAVKRCPEDPKVIAAVASLFASERKHEKARKWLDRSVILDSDLGDSWARYYAFEIASGTPDQQATVKERCIAADPKHGEIWTAVSKAMSNRRKNVGELLDLAAQKVVQIQQLNHKQQSV
jgi:pre-mRNA-processing factor 6